MKSEVLDHHHGKIGTRDCETTPRRSLERVLIVFHNFGMYLAL